MALVLSGCGSIAEDAAEPSASAGQAVLEDGSGVDSEAVGSYPVPDCTGLDPASCTYVGFDPQVDGFGFENWGSRGAIGATEMIALFGRDTVCAGGSGGECVLYPAARQWADQVNEAMSGGHCEGMAVTAELLHGGYLEPTDLDPDASTTFALAKDDPDVARTIEYWWATQMVAPVQQAYQRFHTFEPSQIAAELAKGLTDGAGYTMGIYSPDGGHAVTPIAVTREGDAIAVHVYDNNFPGTVQRIMIDPRSEQWSYAMGSTNPQAPTGGWEGGVGTIELTPMEARLQTPFPAPFDDTKGGGKTSQIMVTSPDPTAALGVLLTIDGTVYDTRDARATLPAGVSVRSIRGSATALGGNWLIVDVDPTVVGAYEAALVRQGSASGSLPVTMSIDDPRSPRVTVRAVDDTDGDLVLDVSGDGTLDIDTSDIGDAEVNVANGFTSANFSLPDRVNMRIDPRDDNGTSQISYLDGEDDQLLGEYALDDESESGAVTDIDAEFQPGDDGGLGSFAITESEVEAEDVDDTWISSVRAAQEKTRADDEAGADDAAVDDSGATDPGADDPGADDPGADDPGATDPGADDPGADDPGADQSDTAEEQ